MTDLPRLPGIDYACASYDPFRGYANSNNIVSTPFDWSKATEDTFKYGGTTYRKPAVITALDQSRSDITSTTGEDIQSYQSNLAGSVSVSGSYNFFSGSLSTEFSVENLSKSENSFSRTQQSASLWSLQFSLNSSSRNLLKDDFKAVLDNLATDDDSCKNFFVKYGSYLLTGILLGGRALRTASTHKYSVDRTYSLAVTAREAGKFASGQVDAEERAKYQNSVSSFESNSDVIESVIGGDPVLASNVFDNNNGGDGWRAWAATVTQMPALIDFAENPLTPIWELCAPDGRGPEVRAALQNYFNNKYAPLRSDELTRRPAFIDALNVVSGESTETYPPQGYTRINYDLNRGSGGKYIYASYHKKPYNIYDGAQQAVTDIAVIYDNEPVPDGYTKIANDLNEGAGGAFVYLCYKLDMYDEDTAILDMTVIGANNPNVQAPYGYKKLDRDLNAGAGGDFVYFAYAKRRS